MLVDGKWTEDWQPVQAKDAKGGFVRQTSSFRNWVTPDGAPGPTGTGGFPAVAGRYHLYVALICPWACRTLIARRLKGLEAAISVSIVNPVTTPQGWRFGGMAGATEDAITGARYMHEIYTRADPHFTGRATAPVLWDIEQGGIVNNESADILRILNSGFGDLASGPDLYPAALRPEIDALNATIYPRLNNGVYRAGFATTQEAYDTAVAELFETLDWMEARLARQRYLAGDQITEADWRAFTTLVRFDPVYHAHFKCSRNRLADMPNLFSYTRELFQWPGVAGTVDFDHIRRHYFHSHDMINPTRIVPTAPEIDWLAPHGREALARR